MSSLLEARQKLIFSHERAGFFLMINNYAKQTATSC